MDNDGEKVNTLEKPKRERCEKGHYLYDSEAPACERCEVDSRNERAVVASERFTKDCEARTRDLNQAADEHRAYVERIEARNAERHEDWKKTVAEQTEAIKAQTVAFERIANALEKAL